MLPRETDQEMEQSDKVPDDLFWSGERFRRSDNIPGELLN
jgi:hypothetical protein